MGRKTGIRAGIVLFVLVAAAAVFSAIGRASDPRFDQIQSSVGPSIVSAGANVLYKAQWHYIDNQTLTHSVVEITVPDGWTLSSSDPAGCTQSGTLISCTRGTIRTGDYVRQAVELTTDADLGSQTITSLLRFYEGPYNPGRVQRLPAPNASTTVISNDQAVEPNRAGKCLDAGQTVATALNAGGSSSSALGPVTTALCTPVSLDEHARVNPNQACLPAPFQCVTDIVTTDAPAGSTDNPIQLTIIFYGNGLNNRSLIFSSATTGTVPQCTDPAKATPDPCWFGHVARQRSVTWSVNWSGIDPSWTS